MRKWLVFLIAALLSFPAPARAQTPVALEALTVMLWPEYDQPSMLVIQNFTVTGDTQVPTTMVIRVPRDANVTAVAYQSPSGLLLANYQSQPAQGENWQTITLFITERTNYHIEYYQPLERSGDIRSFTYQWMGDFPIRDFKIEVQVPADSKGVKTDPAIPFMQSGASLNGGATMSGLVEGETYQLELEYSRSSESVLATPVSQQVEPLAPVDENASGRSTLDNLPLFLGGFGAALILAALVYFIRGQSSANAPKPRKRSQPARGSNTVVIYCHECGTRAQEGDRFCRACGSKLRGG